MTDIDAPDRDPHWQVPPSAINDMARATMAADAVRYSDSVTVRCQPVMTAMVARAAKSKGTRPAEYVRQALLTTLQLDGFDPTTVPARDAGTLYDARDGQRCYALVSNGRVLTVVSYSAKPDLSDANHWPAGYVPADGDAWLPIVHVDSEPFDGALHWRLPHLVRIEADRVVREFPVIPKSLEAM